ncbi:Scr1 family TA system antitoxin-like transcriptional regulator [Streptomyces sp. NPDC002888]|uniref:Scr1 family TA system antitoxin-like transcriptional regulator n=1 Tax=Streptomyces sp. NPDC002888 TaxID=3364668 RepID=UPI00369D3D0F
MSPFVVAEPRGPGRARSPRCRATFIPGLLQAEVRQARQSVLTRPDGPLKVWAVIHEAALHQRFALRPTTMREQLQRLLDVADMPHVTLQVMPSDATPHPGNVGGFSWSASLRRCPT